jgi:hypothetical protein
MGALLEPPAGGVVGPKPMSLASANAGPPSALRSFDGVSAAVKTLALAARRLAIRPALGLVGLESIGDCIELCFLWRARRPRSDRRAALAGRAWHLLPLSPASSGPWVQSTHRGRRSPGPRACGRPRCVACRCCSWGAVCRCSSAGVQSGMGAAFERSGAALRIRQA